MNDDLCSGRSPSAVPRVLHVVGVMNVAGAETLLMNLYRGVDRDRVQFDFVSYEAKQGAYDSEIASMGGRVWHLPAPRDRGVRGTVHDLRHLLRERGPYLAVHAHVLHASALALRAAKREGVRIRIAHSHSTGDVPGGLGRKVYSAWSRRVISRDSTRLVACGAEAGRYLFGDHPWTLLRNGVDLGDFHPPTGAVREAVRAELGVGASQLLVGAVARMEVVKNHFFILRLVDRLRRDNVDFRLVLAGEGSLRSSLEEQTRELGLDGLIQFLGVRRDTARLMGALDVLVMPSFHEGIPVVLMEAQAIALRCLVSDAVSDESDFGLGIVEFLPIHSVDPWVKRLTSIASAAPDRAMDMTLESWTSRIRARGGDVRESIEVLYDLYDLDSQR